MAFMDLLENKIYYPMLLSEEGADKERSSEEYKAIWKQYLALPQIKQDILADSQLPIKIKGLRNSFHLSEDSIWNMSLMIRKIFFGELSLAEAEAKIGAMLAQAGGEDPNQARAIVEFIQREIMTIQPKPRAEETEDEEKKPQVMTVNLPLLQALSKYHNLCNQLITAERIKVKSQTNSVRPSLINWLKYYRDELGIGQHNSVERGEFLFRSENGRKLSAEERERIGLILKSVEEHLPLAIDTEHHEIIFPSFQGAPTNIGQQSDTALNTMVSGQSAAKRKDIGKPAFPSVTSNSYTNFNFAPVSQRTEKLSGKPAHPVSGGPGRNSPSNSVAGEVSFSAGHIFPAEKEEGNNKAVPKMPAPPSPRSVSRPVLPSYQSSSFRIRPMSQGVKGEQKL